MARIFGFITKALLWVGSEATNHVKSYINYHLRRPVRD
jgi:hypothetical protein